MRAPRRRRPLVREIAPAPQGTDLAAVAARASYIGSPEHKILHPLLDNPDPGRMQPFATVVWPESRCSSRVGSERLSFSAQSVPTGKVSSLVTCGAGKERSSSKHDWSTRL